MHPKLKIGLLFCGEGDFQNPVVCQKLRKTNLHQYKGKTCTTATIILKYAIREMNCFCIKKKH